MQNLHPTVAPAIATDRAWSTKMQTMPNGCRRAGPRPGTPCPSAGQCRPTAGHSVPSAGLRPALRAPVQVSAGLRPALPCPSAARAGLQPGTPWPSAGLRPANGFQCPVHCCIVCILDTNHQADASGQAPILSMVLRSNVSPGVHPHRDQPSCPKPRLDKMVSAGAPHWRGAQAQWLYKCGSGCRLLLLILIAPPDVSPGVHPHRDQSSCHKPRLDKMVSAGGPQLRGTHDHWLVKRLNPVPVVIGEMILMVSTLFGGSALLGLKSLPHPLSWVWGRSVFGFL